MSPCPPATRPPAYLPMFPTSPSQAQLSSPCHLVPGSLPPQDAPEHPSPGILHPRHPLLHASSHDQGTWGISVPKWDGSRADSLPLLLRRVCRAEPGTALAFSPFPAPPGTVRPLCSPCQGQAAMGPLLVLSAPPPWSFFGQGVTRGGRGHNQAPPTFLSHSRACLHGSRTRGCHRSGCPVLSHPGAAPLGWDTSAWGQGQGTLAQGDPAALPRDLGCLSFARALLELSLHSRGEPGSPSHPVLHDERPPTVAHRGPAPTLAYLSAPAAWPWAGTPW